MCQVFQGTSEQYTVLPLLPFIHHSVQSPCLSSCPLLLFMELFLALILSCPVFSSGDLPHPILVSFAQSLFEISIVLSTFSKRIHSSVGPRKRNRKAQDKLCLQGAHCLVEGLGTCTTEYMRCRLYAVGIQLFGKTSWEKYLGEVVFHGNQDHNEGLLSREHSLNTMLLFLWCWELNSGPKAQKTSG